MRSFSTDLKNKASGEVEVAGWVNSRRDHGGLIFIDLRDHKGIIQLVVTPENAEAFSLAEKVRDEFVLRARGTMRKRASDLINPHIETGEVEIVVSKLELLNRSLTPPVNTHDEGEETSEELRLKYRFLDLRRPKMQKILRRRAEFMHLIRDYMEKHEFIEVTTPILANSSPEGARDFLVPSRMKPGQFYALPQAPQQFKQLLMVGGVPKYYQIAPCFRDEDPRADRLYGDFYQLDLEMSFVEEGETVREEVEPLMIELAENFGGKKIVMKSEAAKKFLPTGEVDSEKHSRASADYEKATRSEENVTVDDEKILWNENNKHFSAIARTLIPRLPYEFCMDTYGVDKPDLRYGLEMVELKAELAGTNFKVFQTEDVKAILVPGGARFTRSEIDKFTEKARKLGAGGLAYIIYEKAAADAETAEKSDDDGEGTQNLKAKGAVLTEKSPIAKFLTREELDKIREKTGAKAGDAVFFGAGKRETVNKVLGQLRIAFADKLGLKNEDEVAFCFVTDFPFYEWDDGARKLDFGHNPFSMPKGGIEALEKAKTTEDYLKIVADQYDMVMNGYEICSGAVRNHNPEIMYKVFSVLGYDEKYVEERFGGLLNAFKFGAPPHAGCAFGLERVFMVLENIENIRDTVAFPKNGAGVDLMMNSPSLVDEKQLEEAHLEVREEE